MKYTLIPIALFILVNSCSVHDDAKTGNSKVLHIDTVKGINHESVNIENIFLDTETYGPLGEITSVIYRDSLFFVFDRGLQQVIIFNRDGEAANQIRKIGNGPGEYSDAGYMDIDNYRNVYVSDLNRYNIVKYLAPDYKNFEYIHIDNPFLAFCVVDSSCVYLNRVANRGDFNIRIAKYDVGSKDITNIIDSSYEHEYRAMNFAGSNIWRSENGKLYYYDRFTPDIYNVCDEGLIKKYELSGCKFPDKKQVEQLKDYFKYLDDTDLNNPDNVLDLGFVYETPKHLFLGIECIPPKRIIYDKSTGEFYDFKHYLPDGSGLSYNILGTAEGKAMTYYNKPDIRLKSEMDILGIRDSGDISNSVIALVTVDD